MKIVVASAFEASSQKAHAINTVKIAEGFAKLGHQTHLICVAPQSGPLPVKKLEDQYGIQHSMQWHQIPPYFFGKKITPNWPFFIRALPIILPDAVDLHMFIPPDSLSTHHSPYPPHTKNVVYTGHLYDYKGIPTILQTAALLPDIHFHLVGGLPKDIQRHQTTIESTQLHN